MNVSTQNWQTDLLVRDSDSRGNKLSLIRQEVT